MKIKLTLLLFLFGQVISAQTFTESTNLFEGVFRGSIAFADIDGDGDQDLMIAGSSGFSTPVLSTSLYLNDGSGNFTQIWETPFPGVLSSTISFADVDLDGDQDVFITGRIAANFPMATLYLNDGEGEYTASNSSTFTGVDAGTSNFADIDGDGDLDLFVTGLNLAGSGTATLYANDGLGNFTEVNGTPFLGVLDSAVGFSDVDQDGDLDMLINGVFSPGNPPGPIAELYLNDGEGDFDLVNGTPFDPSYGCTISFADIDGDNDEDVLITGNSNVNSQGELIAKLYTNDGSGNFTEVVNTPFEGINLGSVALADIDGDSDQDVVISGRTSTIPPNTEITALYINDGFGTFTPFIDNPFEEVDFSAIAFSDVDGDNDQDLMITGMNGNFDTVAKLYINDVTSSAVEINNISTPKFSVYPNPVTERTVTINFTSEEQKQVTISLVDATGRTVKETEEYVSIGENIIPYRITSFPKGSYFIKIDDGKTKAVQEIIIY